MSVVTVADLTALVLLPHAVQTPSSMRARGPGRRPHGELGQPGHLSGLDSGPALT